MIETWKADISRREVIILISRCCVITNTLDMLLKCIDYLEKPSRDQTASTLIQDIGNEDIIDDWTEFIIEDDRKRKERSSSQTKKRHRHKHQAKSGFNRSQRQVRRYMKALALAERTCLVNSFKRLRKTGELYNSSGSESEADSTE